MKTQFTLKEHLIATAQVLLIISLITFMMYIVH